MNRKTTKARPVFYNCEICGANHAWAWNGDCREDRARYFADELDARFGPLGWEERSMSDRVAADASTIAIIRKAELAAYRAR